MFENLWRHDVGKTLTREYTCSCQSEAVPAQDVCDREVLSTGCVMESYAFIVYLEGCRNVTEDKQKVKKTKIFSTRSSLGHARVTSENDAKMMRSLPMHMHTTQF